jgi:tetratricopeptide (TPR) repeat protein
MKVIWLLLPAVSLLAAATEPAADLQGQVDVEGRAQLETLRIEVRPGWGEGGAVASAAVNKSGEFRVDGLTEGVWSVIAVTPHGGVAARQVIHYPAQTHVKMRLAGEPAPLASVSMYLLTRKISKQTWREYDQAIAALARHDRESAVQHLDEALRLEPTLLEALEHRGLIAVESGELELGERLLKLGAEVDPGSRQALVNASYVYLRAGKWKPAEHYARAALRLDPSCDRGYYLLAASLSAQGKKGAELERSLQRASTVFPAAKATLDRMDRRNPGVLFSLQ